MLTKKQLELLRFIESRVSETGIPPSFDEMKVALDLASKSGIHRLIKALEERGYIRRLPNRARAVEIIRMPELASAASAGFKPIVLEGGKGREGSGVERPAPVAANDAGGISIPVMGRIAAGSPISAIQEVTHEVVVSPDLIAQGEHYALEVKGDSMIEAGILDGDTVIIRRGESASAGEIVVALVDDEEATLKRIRHEGGKVALEAANPAHPTRYFERDQVKVQGRLAGLVRRYH